MMDIGTPLHLSVVMSTYNDEKHIEQAIQSILDQSYPFFEFIIVDDGSTDSTNSKIKNFNDSRIKLIEKSNTGLPDSLNVGFSAANYDWVARMDSDDVALPDRFKDQIKLIHEDYAIIGSNCFYINEFGNIIGHTNYITNSRILKFLLRHFFSKVIHPTVIINKKMFDKAGGYDINLKAAQDVDLWLRLSKIGEVVNSKNKLLLFRIHENRISTNRYSLQRKNYTISIIKQRLNIQRVLTKEEYSTFCEKIDNSRLFNNCFSDVHNYKYLLHRKLVTLYNVINREIAIAVFLSRYKSELNK